MAVLQEQAGTNILGKLHTNATKYLNPYNFNFKQQLRHRVDKNSALQSLKAKEKQFYQRTVGASTYQEFYDKIQSIFEENQQDFEVLRRFSNARGQLREDLQKRFTSTLTEVHQNNGLSNDIEVQFHLDSAKIDEQIRQTFLQEFGKDKQIHINKNTYQLRLGFDTQYLKDAFTNVFKISHFKKLNKDNNGNLYYSNNTETLENILKDLIKNGILTNTSAGQSDYLKLFKAYSKAIFPFGYTREMIDNLREDYRNDPESLAALERCLEQAIEEIENYILRVLGAGASQKLLNIMRAQLDDELGKYKGAKVYDIFMQGTNFLNGVVGALGEFQVAILFRYLSQATDIGGTLLGNQIVYEIQGEQYQGIVQKGKVDVEFFEKLGVQVKNYSLNANLKELEWFKTSMSPQKYSALIEGNTEKGEFLTFLANYFFNQSFTCAHSADFQEILDFVGEQIWELFNLAILDSLNDVVTFYMISGTYFVPGSFFIEELVRMESEARIAPVTITSQYQRKNQDDDYFWQTTIQRVYGRAIKEGEIHHNFSPYWRLIGGKWTEQPENFNLYNDLINHFISIKTSYNWRNNDVVDNLLARYNFLGL